jgi:hypothetical protein
MAMAVVSIEIKAKMILVYNLSDGTAGTEAGVYRVADPGGIIGIFADKRARDCTG